MFFSFYNSSGVSFRIERVCEIICRREEFEQLLANSRDLPSSSCCDIATRIPAAAMRTERLDLVLRYVMFKFRISVVVTNATRYDDIDCCRQYPIKIITKNNRTIFLYLLRRAERRVVCRCRGRVLQADWFQLSVNRRARVAVTHLSSRRQRFWFWSRSLTSTRDT